VILRDADGVHEYALMHLQPHSVRVRSGQRVHAGTPLGKVGHTGDAQGPHLHFEEWVGPWQTGGHAIDPLPLLQSWDTAR
jgi:murein DD-endopeptidase MepM/ murein hydrolase activator NlpD